MQTFKTVCIIAGKIVLTVAIVLLLVLIGFLLYAAVTVAAGKSVDDILSFTTVNLTQMIIQGGAFIAGTLIMYAAFERKRGWNLGFKQGRVLRRTIEGLLAGIVLMTAAGLLIWVCGGISGIGIAFDRNVLASMSTGLLMFTIVSVNEELFARGYLQGLIGYHFGRTVAVIASSLLFAALHLQNNSVLDNPLPLLNLFLAGIILGVSREASGGLWMPIGLHLTWNYFQGYVYGFEVSGTTVDSLVHLTRRGSDTISGGSFGAEGSALTTLVLLLGIFAIVHYYRSRGRSDHDRATLRP
ncbi:lysostaphin resistance A-like protein [Paenibacillus sp. MBLB4367]|uniref:CPBP family intramembrane glutamic endopeptidase n=1 Tax=Paenibacillus sp. MBLB4367 TaxID=3384767 RepID=UPI0039080BE9